MDTLDPHEVTLQTLSQLNQASECEKVETSLTKDGEYGFEVVYQLDALALNIDITIEDIARPGYLLAFYSGTRKGLKARAQVLLLLRNDGFHPFFNSNFEPLTDRASKAVFSSGHFWLAKDSSCSPEIQHRGRQGNRLGSELARP